MDQVGTRIAVDDVHCCYYLTGDVFAIAAGVYNTIFGDENIVVSTLTTRMTTLSLINKMQHVMELRVVVY